MLHAAAAASPNEKKFSSLFQIAAQFQLIPANYLPSLSTESSGLSAIC